MPVNLVVSLAKLRRYLENWKFSLLGVSVKGLLRRLFSRVKELGREESPGMGKTTGKMEHESRSRKLVFAHAPVSGQAPLFTAVV